MDIQLFFFQKQKKIVQGTIFFCFTIHKKQNKSYYLDKIFYVPEFVGFQIMLIIDEKNILKILKNFNSLAFHFLFRSCLSILCTNLSFIFGAKRDVDFRASLRGNAKIQIAKRSRCVPRPEIQPPTQSWAKHQRSAKK